MHLVAKAKAIQVLGTMRKNFANTADYAPADSLPACAEPSHLVHGPKSSLISRALATSLAAALIVACGGRGGDSAT